MSTERDSRIQEQAYYIWERQGRPHGRAFDHWLQAERELDAAEAKPAEAGTAAAKKPRAKRGARRTATTKKSKRSAPARPGANPR